MTRVRRGTKTPTREEIIKRLKARGGKVGKRTPSIIDAQRKRRVPTIVRAQRAAAAKKLGRGGKAGPRRTGPVGGTPLKGRAGKPGPRQIGPTGGTSLKGRGGSVGGPDTRAGRARTEAQRRRHGTGSTVRSGRKPSTKEFRTPNRRPPGKRPTGKAPTVGGVGIRPIKGPVHTTNKRSGPGKRNPKDTRLFQGGPGPVGRGRRPPAGLKGRIGKTNKRKRR